MATQRPAAQQQGFDISKLLDIVNEATTDARNKIDGIRNRSEAISIADMFDMQMMMNHLSQLSEMSGAVVSASNGAIATLARKISG